LSGSDDDVPAGQAQRHKRKIRHRWEDIVSYGTGIVVKLEGETLGSFTTDADLHDLIYFRLLCVSEAVRNILLLEPDIEGRYPSIPWPKVRAIGNVLRHEYGDLDPALLWQTFARGQIHDLIRVAQDELSRLDG
jgi:uncharacterized protein with HEPN domain